MKKSILLATAALLLAACAAEPEGNDESESSPVDRSETSQSVESSESVVESEPAQESEEEVEPVTWHIDQSSGHWNGSTITLSSDEAILEFPLPETLVVSKTTFELVEAEDYSATEAVKRYEVFVPHGVNYDGEAEPFQNDLFTSEEVEGGTLFISEDLEGSENYDYLAPRSLHIYESNEELREIVVFDDFSTFILAFSEPQPAEDYREISLSYDSLHENLKLLTPPGMTLAQEDLQEILDYTPDSRLVPFHQDLIDQAAAYFEAQSESDREAMQDALEAMSEVRYANLKGVFDSYLAHYENLTP